jgi:hypothetical protein
MKHNYLTFSTMKKTLLMGALLLAGLTANAQLADGSVAPDFDVTDINGEQHHLQDYLDAGKTVVLYISATWCNPCWQFHNTHYLAEVYNYYGPEASDDVVILYVEGDPNTTVNDIHGIPSANGSTQGDWTAGTPYPIIDSASIANSYDISYFPTIYRICPETGTTTEINRGTPYQLLNQIKADCHPLVGLPNLGEVSAANQAFCDATGHPYVSLGSRGSNINSATVELYKNGELEVTQTFESLTVADFGTTKLSFTEATIDPTATYHAVLTGVNGTTSALEAEVLTTVNFTGSINDTESSNNIYVNVYTDRYPGEMSWYILDSNEAIVASHQYVGKADGSAGGQDALQFFSHPVTLPEGIDCYTVVQVDGYGDGWVDGTTSATRGMKIVAGDGTIVYTNNGAAFSQIYKEAAFKTTGILGAEKFELAKFAIFPNPSTGIFNFATEEAVDITVLDITGKTVFTAKGIDNGGAINLSGLQKGMYIAKVNGATSERIEKIVIK